MPMRIRTVAALIALIAPLSAVRAAGQVPVEPYDASGSYGTTLISLQAGAPEHGREFALGRGGMRAFGRQGRWMRRVEMLAGFRVSNTMRTVLAGPQALVGAAFPGQFMMVGATRAEPYVLAGAGLTGILALAGGDESGLAPGVLGGAGVRLLGDDPWDVSLDYVEVVAERRFGEMGEGWQVYVRLGRAVGRGTRNAPPPRGAPPASPPRR